jgi:hypothetical protein
MQLLGHSLRFERRFAQQQRLEQLQGSTHQVIAGEHAANAGQTVFGLHGHQRMHAIVRLEFIAPTSLRRGAAQSRAANGTDFH